MAISQSGSTTIFGHPPFFSRRGAGAAESLPMEVLGQNEGSSGARNA
jgi:hypothetical protein